MTIMAKPFVPALSSDLGIITNRQEITATLVRWVLLNPGFLTTTSRDEVVSFRELAGRYGHDRNLLCDKLSAVMIQLLQRHFPNDTVLAFFTPFDYDETNSQDPRYGIKFDIKYQTANNELVAGISDGTFIVASDGSIEIHYQSIA